MNMWEMLDPVDDAGFGSTITEGENKGKFLYTKDDLEANQLMLFNTLRSGMISCFRVHSTNEVPEPIGLDIFSKKSPVVNCSHGPGAPRREESLLKIYLPTDHDSVSQSPRQCRGQSTWLELEYQIFSCRTRMTSTKSFSRAT